MSGTWPLRLAYRTGQTKSPKASRCLAKLSPHIRLTINNTAPVRPTPSSTPTPRRTRGRTQTPAPIRESDLHTIESNIGRVPTRTPVHDRMRQGPIRSPSTLGPTHMLCTNPRHRCPSRCHSPVPSYIKRRVVHKRFPPNRIMSCIITLTTHRVGDPHTSSDHRSWEVFLHRYGCRTQCVSLIPFSLSEWRGADDILFCCYLFLARSRRQNGRSRCSSACLRASDHGDFPLRVPRQNPSTHHQGGISGGGAFEFPFLLRLAPIRHRHFMLS